MATQSLPAPPTAARPATPRAPGTSMVVVEAAATKGPPPRRSAIVERIKAEAAGDAETLYGMAAAGALGLAERYNFNYPHLPMLDKTATPAIALYVAAKVTGSGRLKALARGAVHVATYKMAAGADAGNVSGDGGEEELSGRI